MHLNDSDIANYADDNTPFCIGESVDDVIEKLEKDYNKFIVWINSNNMKANHDKLQLFIPKYDDNICINIENEINLCIYSFPF